MRTRTGGFPIGFRRMPSEWQKDLPALIRWAGDHGLEVIDLPSGGGAEARAVIDAGLHVGAVDLVNWDTWKGMISPVESRRQEAVRQASDFVAACAAAGSMNHFMIMLPEDPDRPRAENFTYMVESIGALAPVLEENGARLVVEGWPGPGALCCTPADCRALFDACPSRAIGINYDPSHLIRMGIAPLRFLREFADRVYHVHGKDTELDAESLYLHGHEQPPTFAEGAGYWHYRIPGHGLMRWTAAFRALAEAGYNGCVSIEHEDGDFLGSQDAEKLGILKGAAFLEGC